MWALKGGHNMKYSKREMALETAYLNTNRCAIGFINGNIAIFCDDPEILQIPESPEEQWYLRWGQNGTGGKDYTLTNKHNTKNGLYEDIEIFPIDMLLKN